MATIYISEFQTLAFTDNNVFEGAMSSGFMSATPLTPPLADQSIAIGTLSTQSSNFNIATSMVILSSDHAASIAFGSNPIATTNSMRIAANQIYRFGVVPGQRLAVIQNS